MKTEITQTPRSNSLDEFDFALLERVPAYLRKGVKLANTGKVITATSAATAAATTGNAA